MKDGFKIPVSLVQRGDTAWLLEAQLDRLFDPKLGKPGPFRAYAMTLPRWSDAASTRMRVIPQHTTP